VNHKLLITGGTGSFGNAVLNKFIKDDFFSEIRILSRDEKKQHDLRISISSSKVKFYIGDVRDYESVDLAVKGVDYIFHAAALKQVPSCEFFPIEAVKTNVNGAYNVMLSGIRNDVKKIVVLSTDKAVYPINAMGQTKALMEKVMVSLSRTVENNTTVLCGTRYGNVMGSRGSVIPLFINQIKSNSPITITDPSMTRFMMSLEDAVELVLFAFKNGKQGDIYVQKSPASTILTVAESLKHIFNSNVPIKLIGTRHGEKLFETLVSKEEMARSVDLGGYYCIPSDNRDLNYDRYFVEGIDDIEKTEDYNSHNTTRLDVNGTVALLKTLDFINNDLSGFES
jgi:UDP-glucose 4-epimerase